MIRDCWTDDFYMQSIPIQRRGESKLDWLLDLCKGREVLHVGCVNSPFVSQGQAEHEKLASVASRIDGCDTDMNGLMQLKEVVDGNYFGRVEDVVATKLEYDIVLVSNVLEHIADPSLFLSWVFAVRSREILIVVPNAVTFKGEYDADTGTFREWVHRDHLCWYSPYTFLQTLWIHLIGTEEVSLHFIEAKDDQIAAHIVRPKGFFVPKEGCFSSERDREIDD